MHNFNLYSLDLLLYRPIKKDCCDRCTKFANNIATHTEEDENDHKVHKYLGDIMKARMAQAERTCVSRECVENRGKGTKK